MVCARSTLRVEAVVACLFACMACGQSKGGAPSDAALSDAVSDVSVDASFVDGMDGAAPRIVGCGGTVQASGTSPVGPFTATGLNVAILQNCAAVYVDILDESSGAILGFSLPLPTADADMVFQMSGDTVFGSFSSPALNGGGRKVDAPTKVTFTGSDPFAAPDAGGSWGTLDGTFETVPGTTGISISGSFSSPYCLFNKGGCSS
jgi:hypothetical protein